MPISFRSLSVRVRKMRRSTSCSSNTCRYFRHPICSRNVARSCSQCKQKLIFTLSETKALPFLNPKHLLPHVTDRPSWVLAATSMSPGDLPISTVTHDRTGLAAAAIPSCTERRGDRHTSIYPSPCHRHGCERTHQPEGSRTPLHAAASPEQTALCTTAASQAFKFGQRFGIKDVLGTASF